MSVDFSRLWQNAHAAQNETESVRALAEILSLRDGRKFILTLGRPEAEQCIEILSHTVLATRNLLQTPEKQAFLDTLRRLSVKHMILPEAMVITDQIDYPGSDKLQTSGGFADIKPGEYRGHTVAVKTMRLGMSDDFEKIRKQFCHEVTIWNSLSHPNILELVGVLDGFREHRFAIVSEWMVHGNIVEYTQKNAANRLKLLNGAVKGLKYLHDANVIHGDLKGANILVTNDTPPSACLADFGFTALVPDPQDSMSSSLTLQGGTMPFMAPELLAPSRYGLKVSVPTQKADVYAFGLVVFQVLTGEQPFRDYKPQELPYYVSLGVRPKKPPNAKEIGISNSLWWLMEMCWNDKIEGRPQIQEVVNGIDDAAANWHTDMPPSGTGQRKDSAEEDPDDFRRFQIFGSFHSDEPLEAPDEDNELLFNHSGHEPVFNHSDQDNSQPPTTLPPKKRNRFRHQLKKILGLGTRDYEPSRSPLKSQ